MKPVTARRRAAAIVALAAPVVAVAVIAASLVNNLLPMLAGVVGVGVTIAAAAYALTRTGLRRALASIAAIFGLAVAIAAVAAEGHALLLLIVLPVLAVAAAATRFALGRDIEALKSEPTPGRSTGPASRAVLIVNPASGDGKAGREGLVDEARRRGIETIELTRGDDLLALARRALAGGADAIGMAGGDGSQGLVAGVAMEHDVAYVCIPAGTRNHFAMDLGLDRDDIIGALDAFGQAVERRIDLATVGDRVFVNNTSIGLYAKVVQSPEYRNRKVGTALDLLPEMLGPDAAPFDLRFTGPDGSEHRSAHLILVSNGRYFWGAGAGFGSRRHMDAGTLGILVARFQSSSGISAEVRTLAAGPSRRSPSWIEWTDTSFEVHSGAPVEVGIDGEAIVLEPPIRFRIVPGALRVRIPHSAPGYSPAAAEPTRGWSTVTALLQTTAGRPVSIGSDSAAG